MSNTKENTEIKVCPKCGQNPCICPKASDVCPKCGKNPCVCPKADLDNEVAVCSKCGQNPCVCPKKSKLGKILTELLKFID